LIPNREIAQLNEELSLLQEESSKLQNTAELRVKQFQLLLFAIHQLEQGSLQDLANSSSIDSSNKMMEEEEQSKDSMENTKENEVIINPNKEEMEEGEHPEYEREEGEDIEAGREDDDNENERHQGKNFFPGIDQNRK
jgi:hypothetical protein